VLSSTLKLEISACVCNKRTVLPQETPSETESPGLGHVQSLLALSIAAIAGGLLVGLIGGAFRWALEFAGRHRTEMIEWSQQYPWWGWVAPVLVAAIGAGVAKWLVRFAPVAAGSGVQHVEAVMRGEATRAPLRVIPIKFFGGLLSIGSGLALGREGPTVQMGSTIGAEIASRFKLGIENLRDLQAALAGAGLAVAFNAPVGGAAFVFEEVGHKFKVRLMLPTLIGCCMAICVSRGMLGDHIEFEVPDFDHAIWGTVFPYLGLGLILGLLGIYYNQATIACLKLFDRFTGISMEGRAAIVGAMIGLIGFFAPTLIGGGEVLNQAVLSNSYSLGGLILIFLVRWVVGPLSYSAGTPGGLFAPLLLVGAAFGAIFGELLDPVLPSDAQSSPVAFAVVGMSAFFTAVVRAPLTGIVLITEMTGSTSLLIPMLAANFGALFITTALKAPPIYDTLRARMLADPKITGTGAETRT